MENTKMGKRLTHFSFLNLLEDGYGSKMIQTWLMAVHIGLLLLIPYDDTVKIGHTTNDAVMLYSSLQFLSNILS